jgi:two-component sensor histidine kinase
MSFVVAGLGEAIRDVLEKALRAERQSAMFLQELQHRTQNTLAMIVSLLELQAATAGNPQVREALKTSAGRVRLQSDAHRHLTLRNSGKIDANEYLKEVCGLLQQTLQGIRPVEISCSAQSTLVDPQKALAIGLITNELVTNAVKYAFENGAKGKIAVALEREASGRIRLSVTDDGTGCPGDVEPGMGTRLVTALAKEYRGTFERVNRTFGCEAIVTLFPKPQAPLL